MVRLTLKAEQFHLIEPFQKYIGVYSTTLFGDLTKDKLNEVKGSEKPFFIYLSFQAIHAPLEAPQSYVDKYKNSIPNERRRTKAAMMTITDDVIQDIVDTLKANGQWDNTLLIFSTDNGGPENGKYGSNWPLRGAKSSLWEGGVRGAAFINGGALESYRRGAVSNEMMHITDWYPTFVSMAGLDSPINAKSLDGFDQTEMISQLRKKNKKEGGYALYIYKKTRFFHIPFLRIHFILMCLYDKDQINVLRWFRNRFDNSYFLNSLCQNSYKIQ